MVEHKQVEHKPTTSADVVVIAKPFNEEEYRGVVYEIYEKGKLAAEREAWQKEVDYQKKLCKAFKSKYEVAQAALDTAEEIIDHVQTRYEGQVVRGNMLEKMREHQFQRADKAEAKCQNCPLKLLNPSERETVLQAALAKAEARVRELEAALYKKGKWNPEIDEVERILRNAIDKSLPKEDWYMDNDTLSEYVKTRKSR